MESRSGNNYYAYIDGLRAIAVLAVIAYHLDARLLPGGFVGVDIFFVISGFVVSASIHQLPRLSIGSELLRFYGRRLRRILPALIVCLLVTAIASMLFIPESWLSETSDSTGRTALFGFSNWVLASTGNDYFSPRAEFNIYAHTWSLGVEEQFYLLFPLLFLVWTRGGRGRWLSLIFLAFVSAVSLLYAATRPPGNEIQTFYLTTTRFWQLGAGVLLFQLLVVCGCIGESATAVPMPKLLRSVLTLLAFALVGYGLCNARPGHSPWIDGLWPVLGVVLLLTVLLGCANDGLGRWLAAVPLVKIGRLSYSLYLWHWPVMVLLRWTAGLDSTAVKLIAVALTFALATASYRWIELPFRYGRLRKWADWRIVTTGVLALALVAEVQTQINKSRRYASLSTVSRHSLDWYAYARGLRKEFPECRLTTSVEMVGNTQVAVFTRGPCNLTAKNGYKLFVVGDSHAMAYNEMLRRYALIDGVPVRLYGKGGCSVANVQAWQDQGADCAKRLQDSLGDILKRSAPGDVLFLPGLRVPRLNDQYTKWEYTSNLLMMQETASRGRTALVAATVALLHPFSERGVRVVFEAPKPVLQAPPYRCSDWFNRGNHICASGIPVKREMMERYRAPAYEALNQIVAALPGAGLWDPFPQLCGPEWCTGEDNGKPLYFDGDHISGHGNRVLLPSFRAYLQRPSRRGGACDICGCCAASCIQFA